METHNADRPHLMVVSHERSGTHFVMNALAENGGYRSEPWINLDFQTGLNLHAPRVIAQIFAQYAKKPALNIVKSHHQLAFFEPVLEGILQDFRIVYMVRHPATLMPSLMRYLNAWAWDEGPRCTTPSELIRAEPSGAMLRYQKRQVPNLVARWRAHVEPWVREASRRPGIAVVRYEDLDGRFDATMASLLGGLGLPAGAMKKPDAMKKVVLPNQAREGAVHAWMAEDLAFIRAEAGPVLEELYP
ncbi:MAG: sulfotransferase domain-containing protein [Acidobacteria bacterium]|nr:sulfotransferase domain-containing protein [Acidobacteriota bacterium]